MEKLLVIFFFERNEQNVGMWFWWLTAQKDIPYTPEQIFVQNIHILYTLQRRSAVTISSNKTQSKWLISFTYTSFVIRFLLHLFTSTPKDLANGNRDIRRQFYVPLLFPDWLSFSLLYFIPYFSVCFIPYFWYNYATVTTAVTAVPKEVLIRNYSYGKQTSSSSYTSSIGPVWSVPSPELQLFSPTFLRSSNCSPSLWSAVIWLQRDLVLWHSLQV